MSQTQTNQDVQLQQQTNGRLDTAPRRVVAPPADVIQRQDRIVAILDMPGADPGSLEVTFRMRTLTVQGKARAAGAGTDGEGVTYAEFELGDYERSFRVGERIDAGAITADWTDGVLTVELPLERPARTRVAVRTA